MNVGCVLLVLLCRASERRTSASFGHGCGLVFLAKRFQKNIYLRRRRYASPPVSVAAANEACARRALSRTASSRPPSIDASRNEATR